MKQYLRFLALLCLFLRVAVCRNTFKGISVLVLMFMLSGPLCVAAQDAVTVKGTVVSGPDGEPLAGVNILVKGTTRGVITDGNGAFEIVADVNDVLVFSFIGYRSQELAVSGRTEFSVTLVEDASMLGEVTIYSTGYQELPAERATGSFEHVDEELINRSVSTDIISRLEGVTNSILFDKRTDVTPGTSSPRLRIRGLGSMYGEGFSGVASTKEAPLIVIDNFPYEGDINSLNPNDVESITILKDAAAASIWGARAGNGVIVITTKKGNFGQPAKVTFNSNVTMAGKPDLYYSPEFLSSSQFIEVERELFQRGYFDGDEASILKPVLSPAVELMILERDGLLTSEELEGRLNEMSRYDIRNDTKEHLYRNSLHQQYALNINGGGESSNYYISGGHDKSLSDVIGDQSERVTLNSNNTFTLFKNIRASMGIYFLQQKNESNGMNYNRLRSYSRLPYTQLTDANGLPLAVPYGYRNDYKLLMEEEGLLDWRFYPLKELNLNNNQALNREGRINLALQYDFFDGLSLDFKYQYQAIQAERILLNDKESYRVRNLVNQYTQADGTRIFPYGDIKSTHNNKSDAHFGRAQLNFNKIFQNTHGVAIVAGAEVRELESRQHSFELYGYDDEVLSYLSQFDFITRYPVRPVGTSRLPVPPNFLDERTDRFISYYTNGSYTFDERLVFSGSMRWDASNLFGVKTNHKGVPLLSAGGSWLIDKEQFYGLTWLPELKLRATFGYAGNIDKSATAYPTATYFTDNITGLPYAEIRTPGNPQLRWEKIGTLNLGIDFSTKGRKINGSIEYFRKKSTDLIAPIHIDPTTGFLDHYNINYASLVINGLDLELNALYNVGQVKISNTAILNYVKDEVVEFNYDGEGSDTWYLQENMTLPVTGRPLYTLYSYPWHGLDPATGNPLVNIEGQISTDYAAYRQQLNPSDDLIAHGPKIPVIFGALRNSISYRRFDLSFNILWKAGYYFRRSALNYSTLFNDGIGHSEYVNRWQNPGDEQYTQVPSMPDIPDSNRDRLYTLSEITVEKGDHIRLQDVRFGFRFSEVGHPGPQAQLFIYARNLGILWSASKRGLDPDYPISIYPPVKSISLGFQITF